MARVVGQIFWKLNNNNLQRFLELNQYHYVRHLLQKKAKQRLWFVSFRLIMSEPRKLCALLNSGVLLFETHHSAFEYQEFDLRIKVHWGLSTCF